MLLISELVIVQSLEGLSTTKRQKRGELSLFLSWDLHLLFALDIGHPGSQVFRLQTGFLPLALLILRLLDLNWIKPLAFMVFQFVDDSLWNFLASKITWDNLYISSYILLSVFLKNSNTNLYVTYTRFL